MIINTNMSALIAENNLENTQNNLSADLQHLSSGLRINSAADDAAGLAISEKMQGQINGLNQAQRNAQDGISLIQTAEGAMGQVQNILQRMRELAVQSANDTNTSADRAQIQTEVGQLTSEINRITSTTQFNTQNVINGTFTAKHIQVGANIGQALTITIGSMSTSSLGVSGITVSSQTSANAAISTIDKAINTVSTDRANLGAYQNRLQYAINNLSTSSLNITAAQSRIEDVNMASEMSDFTKNQILSQAGTSMLAQANKLNQSVLSLFQ